MMSMRQSMSCAAAKPWLQAFHDGELPVSEQIAIERHLDRCAMCLEELDELRLLGSALRRGLAGGDVPSREEGATFVAAVVSRRTAEDNASVVARVREVFVDLRLVYAGVTAMVATAICALVTLGLMGLAPTAHPNASPSASLAAILTLVATPGTTANGILVDAASQARGTARFQAASETAAEDAVFTLASIVTRKGRLIDLERFRTGRKATRDQAKVIEELLESVTRASIEPAINDGAPMASDGMVWLVTRTTVRATRVVAVDVPLPPMKAKGIAGLADPSTFLRL
jgi:anti-sigma factor RsiW